MKIQIRTVEEKDYPALFPLWHQFGGYATAENTVAHYNRIKNDSHYQTFVALHEDRIVGFITALQYYSIGIEGSYMVILGIAVDEAIRGQGVGTELIRRMERYAKEHDVFHIYLNSDLKRTDAHAFYEHRGYRKGSYGFGKTVNPI